MLVAQLLRIFKPWHLSSSVQRPRKPTKKNKFREFQNVDETVEVLSTGLEEDTNAFT